MAIMSSQLYDEVIGALDGARQIISDLRNANVQVGAQANASDSDTQSFILKVWRDGLEGRDGLSGENERARWRGHITHVPSGKRHYVQTFSGVQEFIAWHIDKQG